MAIKPAAAAFVLGLLAGTAALAQMPATGDPARGAAGFETTCVKCHPAADRLLRKLPGKTAAEKAAALETYLAGHYAPDAALRADLIAFLTKP